MSGKLRWGSMLATGAVAVALLAVPGGASARSGRVAAPVPVPPGVAGTVAVADTWCPFAGCGLEALVIARRGGHVVAKTRSNAQGRYGMDLPPGRYELLARPRISSIECPRVTVDVPWGTRVRVDFGCHWVRPGAELPTGARR